VCCETLLDDTCCPTGLLSSYSFCVAITIASGLDGIDSALGRTVSEGQGSATISDAIQTDALINPGNSGGALVDLQGNLVRIPTLTAIDPEFNTPANGVGFAIPSNRVKTIVSQVIQKG
jgi:putative serine protease PepD